MNQYINEVAGLVTRTNGPEQDILLKYYMMLLGKEQGLKIEGIEDGQVVRESNFSINQNYDLKQKKFIVDSFVEGKSILFCFFDEGLGRFTYPVGKASGFFSFQKFIYVVDQNNVIGFNQEEDERKRAACDLQIYLSAALNGEKVLNHNSEEPIWDSTSEAYHVSICHGI